jgi:hypothetical protein
MVRGRTGFVISCNTESDKIDFPYPLHHCVGAYFIRKMLGIISRRLALKYGCFAKSLLHWVAKNNPDKVPLVHNVFDQVRDNLIVKM